MLRPGSNRTLHPVPREETMRSSLSRSIRHTLALPLLWGALVAAVPETDVLTPVRLQRSSEGSLLDVAARLKVTNVRLADALVRLRERSGVPLAFSPSLLPSAIVSCNCESVTVGVALRRLFNGLALTFVPTSQQIVIERVVEPADSREDDDFARSASRDASLLERSGLDVATFVPASGGGSIVNVGTVTGLVTQARSLAPTVDAEVSIVGTEIGTLTDRDGRYVLQNVPDGPQVVRVQRLGMRTATQTVTVRPGESVVVNFEMETEALALDEIVVTGTAGAARRREIGNSVAQINLATSLEKPVSVEAALQAQVPGLTVMASSGQPGSAAQIRLRGNVSVSMSNQPLVYVDGVRMRSEPYPKNDSGAESDNRSNNDVQSPLNDLNPSDIERIEVIKGAAATTLYGTEAASGVIQIFTKRGRQGAAEWTADISQGFSQLRPFAPEPEPYLYLEPWLKNAHRQTYNLSVRGGTQSMNYFVSGVLEDNEGVLPNDREERTGLRGNFGFAPLTGMQIQWNTYYGRSETQTTPTGNNSHGLLLNVYRQESNFVGSLEKEVIDRVLEYDTRSLIDRFTTGFTISYTPMTQWSNRFTVGYDLAHDELRQLRPFGFVQAPEGRLSDVVFRTSLLTFDYVGTYDLRLREDASVAISIGGQSVTNDEHTLDGYSAVFPGPSRPTLTTGAQRQSFESKARVINGGLFGQALFQFKDRYFVTVGLRVDGNSAFGDDFGLQQYPKVSLAYVISDETFWPQNMGSMKLRAAYGHAGRAPGAFDAVKTWDPIGWGGLPAYFPRNLGNPNLGPERTIERELGFDAAVLGGRFTAEVTYYSRRTDDALFAVRQTPSLGFQNAQLRNVGVIEASGFEVAARAVLVERESIGWDVGVNLAKSSSKVKSLGGAAEFSLGNNGWIIEGQPVPVIRGTRLVNPDAIAAPELETDYLFGPNLPTLIVGVSTALRLPAGITVQARGEYQGGNYITDGGTANAQSRNITSWPTCLAAREMIAAGRTAELTAFDRQFCIAANYRPSTHIYPADFFKLRDISARAPLPFRIPGTQQAFLTVSARNWLRWLNDDFKIFDPEMMGNEGAAESVRGMNEQYPVPATFTTSLRVVF